MALVKLSKDPSNPDDYGYAVIRNISWDYSSGNTTVHVGFWRTREDRLSNIAAGETLPPARDVLTVTLVGNLTDRADLYPALEARDELAGFTSDE